MKRKNKKKQKQKSNCVQLRPFTTSLKQKQKSPYAQSGGEKVTNLVTT